MYSYRNEYAEHKTCIKQQKQNGVKDVVSNGVKRGDLRRKKLNDIIVSLMEKPDVSPPILNLLKKLLNRNNIPRKGDRFVVSFLLILFIKIVHVIFALISYRIILQTWV